MPRSVFRIGGLVLFQAVCLFAQPYLSGPQVATFFSSIDDSDQPYALYVPKAYDPGKAYPLVISLHGAWSNHRLNLRRVFGKGNMTGETDLEATRYFPPFPDVDVIVASPFARGTMGYQGIPEKDAWDVLAEVKKRFKIDEDRVYLTGLSMGGGGTLWLGLTRPDVWAAIAPVCPSVPDHAEELAPNALNLPVHLFHGDADPAVPVAVSRRWQKNLLDLGVNAEYMEYPGVRHNSWENAYKNGAIFDWFAKHRRSRFPHRVRFVSDRYEYNSAYWTRFDGLTPGVLASIDARFTGRNQVAIDTKNLDGFTLLLSGHPEFTSGQSFKVTVDGKSLTVKAASSLSFTRSPAGWRAALFSPGPAGKRAGSEGPIAAATAARHVYVYGNDGRNLGIQAAEWSTPALHLLVNFRAIADKAVKPSDLAGANLVLLGTKETNTLIAKYAPSFPMELNAGAADYGLVFVYPVDGRYVVVNSGLPWWTGAESARRSPLRYLNPKNQALLSFGDYILFKGSLDEVVIEGRFDSNWKLRPEAAEKLRASGAVSIK